MLYVTAIFIYVPLNRPYLSSDTAISIAQCTVAFRLNYCNSLLYGTLLDKLQRVHTHSLELKLLLSGLIMHLISLTLFIGSPLDSEFTSK